MVYNDYKWTARADDDDPTYRKKPDSSMLNRQEGYEMLYFINATAIKWGWKGSDDNIRSSMQRLEKIIQTEVPSTTRTHSGIRDWISANYKAI